MFEDFRFIFKKKFFEIRKKLKHKKIHIRIFFTKIVQVVLRPLVVHKTRVPFSFYIVFSISITTFSELTFEPRWILAGKETLDIGISLSSSSKEIRRYIFVTKINNETNFYHKSIDDLKVIA